MPSRLTNDLIRRAVLILLALSILAPPIAKPGWVAMAAADPCPEPNASPERACFIGPGGSALGYLDSAEDVDSYALDLPQDALISAMLSGLPADYGLRLTAKDGAARAEMSEPGLQDKTLRADGLAPGRYYLAVFSPRGGFDPDRPYTLAVSYPPSSALTVTTGGGGKQADYVAPPAAQYAVVLADLGPGFHEIVHQEEADGTRFHADFLGDDANLSGDPLGNFSLFYSPTRVSWIHSWLVLREYGDDAALTDEVNNVLNDWRGKYNVEPTKGWGSEQVWSFTQGLGPAMLRGILLKHRNAVVVLQTWGYQQFATWAHISGLMSLAEKRIWAALG